MELVIHRHFKKKKLLVKWKKQKKIDSTYSDEMNEKKRITLKIIHDKKRGMKRMDGKK